MKKLNYIRILQHTGFWICLILFFLIIYGPVFNNYPWLFLSSMIMLPFTITIVYFINYVLLPRFLKEKKYFKLGSYIFLLLLVVPLIPRIIVMMLTSEAVVFSDIFHPNLIPFLKTVIFPNLFDYNLLPFYFETGLITFIALTIKLLKDKKLETEEKNILEQQKLKAELLALRTQLNAHFLFNTLNNLYGLAIKKSDLVPKGILMLSEMLNFVLYECTPVTYPLNKELDFINNYIELEKLRYGKRLKISIEKDIEYSGKEITPLLLFPFVENSFKHGASKVVNDAWIKIRIKLTANELLFEVENNKALNDQSASKKNGGVGLENMRRRLDILYANRHTLTIKSDENTFYICLKITTNQ